MTKQERGVLKTVVWSRWMTQSIVLGRAWHYTAGRSKECPLSLPDVEEHVTMSEYDRKYKVVVVGDSNVGKTSLLFRLKNERLNTTNQSTIGCEFFAHIALLVPLSAPLSRRYPSTIQAASPSVDTSYSLHWLASVALRFRPPY